MGILSTEKVKRVAIVLTLYVVAVLVNMMFIICLYSLFSGAPVNQSMLGAMLRTSLFVSAVMFYSAVDFFSLGEKEARDINLIGVVFYTFILVVSASALLIND